MRTTEPTSVTQGEQIEWTRTFCDYPATEWTLEYRYRGPGTGFNITATADGSAFDAILTAAESAAMTPVGDWEWQAWVTNIADTDIKLTIAHGFTKVLQGFASGTTTPVETRSAAKIALDAIDAALLAFGTSDVVEYEISTPAGSRKVKRSDKVELMGQRKYWAAIVTNEIAREDSRNGKPIMKNIRMRVYAK